MSTDIQKKWMKIQDQVFKDGYYENRYIETLKRHNMSTASVDQSEHSDREIVLAAQTFWELLPDSPTIRREPFFLICDLAEHIFD